MPIPTILSYTARGPFSSWADAPPIHAHVYVPSLLLPTPQAHHGSVVQYPNTAATSLLLPLQLQLATTTRDRVA